MCLVTGAWHQIARLNFSFFAETSYQLGGSILQHKAQTHVHNVNSALTALYESIRGGLARSMLSSSSHSRSSTANAAMAQAVSPNGRSARSTDDFTILAPPFLSPSPPALATVHCCCRSTRRSGLSRGSLPLLRLYHCLRLTPSSIALSDPPFPAAAITMARNSLP